MVLEKGCCCLEALLSFDTSSLSRRRLSGLFNTEWKCVNCVSLLSARTCKELTGSNSRHTWYALSIVLESRNTCRKLV